MNKGVDSMNKIMEMYSPSHKKRVMAEVVEGYAQNGKGGSPRLALKGLFEGKKTLPKKVDVETFEKYGFNAEQTIAAFHAEQVGEHTKCPKCKQMTITDDSEGYEVCSDSDCGWFEEGLDARHDRETYGAEQVGEPLPESPLEDAPPTVPFPQEPSNANFSAEYETMDATFSCPECGCRGCYGCMGDDDGQSCNSCGYVFEDGPTGMGEHQTYNCNECDVRSCHGCIGEDDPSCPSCGVVFEHTMGPFDDDGNYIGNAEEAVYIKGKNSKEPKQEAMFYQVGQEDLGGFIPEKIVPIRTMNERGRNKIVNAMKEAESAFDRLEDEVADEYEEKGMSDEKAQKIGAAVAYTQGVKKYGKKVMTEAAKKGVSAKSLTKNAESLVEEPDWIPDGDGRAFGQQNSAINLSPLHAESQRDSFRAKSNVITIWGVDYDTRIDEYNNTIIEDCGTSILAELEVKTRFDEDYEGLYDRDNEFVYVDYDKNTQECTFSTTDFDVIVELIDDNHVAIEEIGYEALGRKRWKAESQESMILEACGICDKDFASETLNADGYCGSCCDSRLAEFDNRIDFSAETDDEPYYCMDCDDRQKLPVEEMCPKCLTEGQFYCWECCSRNEGDAHFSAESKGISKNAQIALGLTALGVGIAVWKSNDILNLFNKFRGE